MRKDLDEMIMIDWAGPVLLTFSFRRTHKSLCRNVGNGGVVEAH
jgi:hypothetical protein